MAWLKKKKASNKYADKKKIKQYATCGKYLFDFLRKTMHVAGINISD
jgi:hypothetical protein